MSDPLRLPKEFTRNGWRHVQFFREGDLAIFMREWLEDGSRRHYEVVKVFKLRTGRTYPNGQESPVGLECYPTDRQWGTKGWTLLTQESAVAKFRQVVREREERKESNGQN